MRRSKTHDDDLETDGDVRPDIAGDDEEAPEHAAGDDTNVTLPEGSGEAVAGVPPDADANADAPTSEAAGAPVDSRPLSVKEQQVLSAEDPDRPF